MKSGACASGFDPVKGTISVMLEESTELFLNNLKMNLPAFHLPVSYDELLEFLDITRDDMGHLFAEL